MMESRDELIRKGLSYLGRSPFRREVYRRVNGRKTASDIATDLNVSVNQVDNELKKLDKHLIRLKKKVWINKIYEKIPEYIPLRLQDRKTILSMEERQSAMVSHRPTLIRIEPRFDIEIPNLPLKVKKEARKMSWVYPYVYLFENSARHLIISVLGKYEKDWWEKKTPINTKRVVKNRIAQEEVHRWHAKRGAHPIFYSDMRDLYSIIVNNWNDFKDLFPDQAWVKSRFDEVELSRNIVAHNNVLPNDEITRLKLDLSAWAKQISRSVP